VGDLNVARVSNPRGDAAARSALALDVPRVRRRALVLLVTTLACAPAVLPAASAAAADVVDAVRACRAERDDARRLACFDAASARLEAGPAVPGAGIDVTPSRAAPAGDARGATPAAAGGSAAAQMTPEQRFGYRGDVAREALDREKAELPQLEKLTGTVRSVSQQATGDFVVTLGNGQVWAQLPTGTPQRLKTGDEVTITPASLGSFVLKGPSGRGVRVKRLR
jgi:hypothetical protein